jgi:hypothetical protein
MKRKITLLMAAVLIAAITYGGNSKDALRGGLMGAAFGALVSELDHAVDPGLTIPVFAGFGALAGYAWDKDWDRHNRSSCWQGSRYDRRYGHSSYAWRGPYAWYPRMAYAPIRRTRRATPRSTPAVAAPKPRNLHPGVSLMSVPITLANGMQVKITIFNLNGHYVGPKGEHYDSLPSAEMLAERYGK